MPSTGGYFRWPSLHGDTLLFVCEDDLYAVSLSGGVPRRITDAPGPVRRPIISPDGTTVAFTVVEEECQEIYACSVRGGPLSQITFQGAEFARAAAWAPDGSALFFVSSAGQPFPDVDELWYAALDFDGDGVRAGEPTRTNLGPAYDAAFQPGGRGRLLGRNTEDPAVAHWKGYRGGCAGEAWIDVDGDGTFSRLRIRVEREDGVVDDERGRMNVGDFTWATKDVLVFAADDGGGRTNLYSCRLDLDTDSGMGETGKDSENATNSFPSCSRRRADTRLGLIFVSDTCVPTAPRVPTRTRSSSRTSPEVVFSARRYTSPPTSRSRRRASRFPWTGAGRARRWRDDGWRTRNRTSNTGGYTPRV